MKIKRFVAATLQEAKGQIIDEFGANAIILNSRQLKRRGLLGWLGFSQVEVTAAIDEEDELPEINRNLKPIPPDPRPENKAQETAPWQALQRELADTKRLVADMAERINFPDPAYTGVINDFYELLRHTGLDLNFVQELMLKLENEMQPQEKTGLDLVVARGRALLKEEISPLVTEASQKTNRVCLVGPTGVGKTTTIAKLAAKHVLEQELSVALITFDTYRIAAVDQLRTYGEILGIPVQVVLTPADLRRSLKQMPEVDVIFVDSVGRSQQNTMQISELKAFVDAFEPKAVYLTISATTQVEVMQEIVKNYMSIKPTALIFTKLDEAVKLGPMLNLALETGLPIAFLATGQTVPDDLLKPSADDLVSLLLGEKTA